MIDAAWAGSGESFGDTAGSDYTTVAYETGVGKGASINPVKGDTGKTLFVPNVGTRYTGSASGYSTHGLFWPATQRDAANAWAIQFFSDYASGHIFSNVKQIARSLRCVRS